MSGDKIECRISRGKSSGEKPTFASNIQSWAGREMFVRKSTKADEGRFPHTKGERCH